MSIEPDMEKRRAELRLQIARALMGQSLGGGPVASPLQGLARVAGGALGGWMAGRALDALGPQRPGEPAGFNHPLDGMPIGVPGGRLSDPMAIAPPAGQDDPVPAIRYWNPPRRR